MSIRFAREADLPQILGLYAPYVAETTVSFEYEVPTLSEFSHRFLTITRQFPWLVWEEDGRILGYAYGSAPFERAAFSWVAEDSVYLRPEARGRGIGTALCRTLEEILKIQGYRKIYAIITSENFTSLEFHRKMGYSPVSEFQNCGFKFGRWLGITWLDKELQSVDSPSSFPIPWREIMHNRQKFSDILGILSLS